MGVTLTLVMIIQPFSMATPCAQTGWASEVSGEVLGSPLLHFSWLHDPKLSNFLSIVIVWYKVRNIYLFFDTICDIELLKCLDLPKWWKQNDVFCYPNEVTFGPHLSMGAGYLESQHVIRRLELLKHKALSLSFLLLVFWLSSMWDFSPWPGVEPTPSAVEVQNLSHWTSRETAEGSNF